MKSIILAAAIAVLPTLAVAGPQVRITEWMYKGNGGEFIELSNLGDAAANFATYSYDDNHNIAGTVSLAAFGLVGAGQSVIITEDSAAKFRTDWGLPNSVQVLGGNTYNIGRADQINVYNGTTLVDRLDYDDQSVAGTPRTSAVGGRPKTLAAIGANNAALWTLESVGDVEKSVKSRNGDVGSPGSTSFFVPAAPTPAPEPVSLLVLAAGAALLAGVRGRR